MYEIPLADYDDSGLFVQTLETIRV